MQFLKKIQTHLNEYFEPDESHMFISPQDLSNEIAHSNFVKYRKLQEKVALAIGLLIIGLPVGFTLFQYQLPCSLDSISHHYYLPWAGTVFVTVLILASGFLFTYRGESRREMWLAKAAGICALGIAVFPTGGNGCSSTESLNFDTTKTFSARPFVEFNQGQVAEEIKIIKDGEEVKDYEVFKNTEIEFKWFESAETLHHISTSGLFVFLLIFVFGIFTRKLPYQQLDGDLKAEKRRRNTIYNGCTVLMLIAGAGLFSSLIGEKLGLSFFDVGGAWSKYNFTFIMEALFLLAFGVAWLTKSKRIPGMKDEIK